MITIGFREYTGREPFRSISWLQSAKAGRLMVRQYDSTADLSCTVLLNTDCENEERRSEWLELCYSAARNICEELERKKLAYDFKTNGIIAGAMGNWNQVGDGLGAGHLETVLEAHDLRLPGKCCGVFLQGGQRASGKAEFHHCDAGAGPVLCRRAFLSGGGLRRQGACV